MHFKVTKMCKNLTKACSCWVAKIILGRKAGVCSPVQMASSRKMEAEADRSCFLCNSKEDLELCSSCNIIVTCAHHGNLHR